MASYINGAIDSWRSALFVAAFTGFGGPFAVIGAIVAEIDYTRLVRISLKEHDVVDSKLEHSRDDLKLHNPWVELKRYVDDFDIEIADSVIHKNILYVVLLIKLDEEWRNMHNEMLP